MHPPAIAAPLTIAIVGNGNTDILPSKLINSNTNQLWLYCGKLVAYFKANPPLNSFDNEIVTNAVGP